METILDTMYDKAKETMNHAYAPYSNFHVGVCLRTNEDNYFVGCNVENASYALTQCAEASAISAMVSAGFRDIQDIMVISSGDKLCFPCGACRQMIREFATHDTRIHLCDNNGRQQSKSIDDLLPESFGADNFEKRTV